jgi:hypothetical protein
VHKHPLYPLPVSIRENIGGFDLFRLLAALPISFPSAALLFPPNFRILAALPISH